ncbi:hypothetical protein HY256_03805, partial [Candidatus Sumerlaeota bacterium]|nr:hypothetical protein [Candidatus Sumerlaeota bacterium]
MNLFEIEGAPILNLRAWLAASGVYTIAYLAGAALFWMLRLTKGRTCGFEFLLLRLSAGLAVTPLIVLAAGQVPGLLWQIPWWIAALGGGALLVYDAARLLRRIIQENRGRRFSNFLSAAGWIGVFLTLFALVGPAFSPPINYDALEYHLGVIPHYFETKSITPIPHVFYSAQPLATEMLYTLGAVAERTPWGWSAGLVNWMMILLLAALTAQVLKAIGAPQAMIPWLLIVLLTHPIILKLELDRLSDLMGAIFMLAGLLVLSPKETHTHHPGGLDDNLPSPLRHGGWPGPPSERAPKVAQPRWDSRFKPSQDFSDTLSRGLLILAGIFAGAALSAKWTNAGTAVTILTAAYISWLIPAKSNRQALDGDTEQKADVPPPPPARILSLAFSQLAMFMLGLVLIIFPWMIWLWFRAGNPLAPFAARLFPTPAWSAERLEF